MFQQMIIVCCLCGHRRFDAYQRLGYTEVPCVEFPSRDETDILEALVMLNRQREKTSEQIAREAEVLMGVERERAKSRMSAGKTIDPKEHDLEAYVLSDKE